MELQERHELRKGVDSMPSSLLTSRGVDAPTWRVEIEGMHQAANGGLYHELVQVDSNALSSTCIQRDVPEVVPHDLHVRVKETLWDEFPGFVP